MAPPGRRAAVARHLVSEDLGFQPLLPGNVHAVSRLVHQVEVRLRQAQRH